MRVYRGTSLARKRNPLGPYRRPMPRVLRGPRGPRGICVFLWAMYLCKYTAVNFGAKTVAVPPHKRGQIDLDREPGTLTAGFCG